MNKYKPEYLGQIIPADDPSKMMDMLQNKFTLFSSIYDTCKDLSESISDIKLIDNSPDDLTVKIATDMGTIQQLQEKANDTGVNINGDIITAKATTL